MRAVKLALVGLAALLSGCRGFVDTSTSGAPTPAATEQFYYARSQHTWLEPSINPAIVTGTLDLNTGRPSFGDSLSIFAGQLQFESLAEVVFNTTDPNYSHQPLAFAARDLQSGKLTLEPPRFPAGTDRGTQSAVIHPSGKYVYDTATSPEDSTTGKYNVYFRIFERQPDGSFTLLSEELLASGTEWSCPEYGLDGIAQSDGSHYLVVSREIACNQNELGTLSLWKLSAAGDRVDSMIEVPLKASQSVMDTFGDNLIIAAPSFELPTVFQIVNDQVQQVATANPTEPFSIIGNYTLMPSKKTAYALAQFGESGQFVNKIMYVTWDETQHAMSFTPVYDITDTFFDGSSTFPAFPHLQVDPSGQYLVLTFDFKSAMRVLRIENASGRLTEVQGSPFSTPGSANSLTFVPQS